MLLNNNLGIYLGNRGGPFKALIVKVLKRANLKKKYIDMLTDQSSMRIYSSAFTSELIDPVNNYQVLEQVGDLTGNKFIVNYMYNKFPQLDCTEGVKVVARLRINYGAKQSFSEIARQLGFWAYISATNELRQRKMKPLLEDVFEAFLGATERILDRRKRVGVGYAIVYDILTSIFDDMDISLRYEDLYDSKTRLKELFDMHGNSLGPLVYKEQKQDLITYSTVYRIQGGLYEEKIGNGGQVIINKKRIIGGSYIKIGEGRAALKADAQQKAAAVALKNLEHQGWSKPVPLIYQRFNSNIKKKEDDEKITKDLLINRWGNDINALQYTKEKTKYQNKYQSTPLALYCRTRNVQGVIECMSLGGDPNIEDTEGVYPVDLLFIGAIEESLVENIMRKLICDKLKMHKTVFNMYYNKYIGEYFQTIKFNFV
jgi:dsRNA-specific ribonuclease